MSSLSVPNAATNPNSNNGGGQGHEEVIATGTTPISSVVEMQVDSGHEAAAATSDNLPIPLANAFRGLGLDGEPLQVNTNPLPVSYRRPVKMPAYEGKLFQEGQDWFRHYTNWRKEVERHPGLNANQASQFFLDALDPAMRPHALIMQQGCDLPPWKDMAKLMEENFRQQTGLQSYSWEADLSTMQQHKPVPESLIAYVGRVLEKLHLYKTSEQYSEEEYPYMERCANISMTMRIDEEYKDALTEQQDRWRAGEVMPYPDSIFLSNWKQLMKLGKKATLKVATRKANAGNAPVKTGSPRLCRFDGRCTKPNCHFQHLKPKPDGMDVDKKRKTSDESPDPNKRITCLYCKRTGHSENKCWSKHPDMRPAKRQK